MLKLEEVWAPSAIVRAIQSVPWPRPTGWFVGRLQTDADRERVVEGLAGATERGGHVAGDAMAARLKVLMPRWFVVRDVRMVPNTWLLNTRATLSWMRGPMTRMELRAVAKGRGRAARASAEACPSNGVGTHEGEVCCADERRSGAGSARQKSRSPVAGRCGETAHRGPGSVSKEHRQREGVRTRACAARGLPSRDRWPTSRAAHRPSADSRSRSRVRSTAELDWLLL